LNFDKTDRTRIDLCCRYSEIGQLSCIDRSIADGTAEDLCGGDGCVTNQIKAALQQILDCDLLGFSRRQISNSNGIRGLQRCPR